MPKVFARTIIFKPATYSADGVEFTVYEGEEVSWREIEIDAPDRDKLVDEMVVEASSLAYQSRIDEGYSFVQLELPGVEVVEGEGDYSRAETIFYPVPVPINKIVFYKSSGDKAVPVREIVVEKGKYVYDGYIVVKDIDFDLIEIHTSNGTRILFKEELKIPAVTRATGVEAVKKTRKRRRKIKKRSSKTKKTRKSRNTRSKKRKRKRKKSKNK